MAYGSRNNNNRTSEQFDKHLKLDNKLDSHKKPVKIGEDITGLQLSDKDVVIENDLTINGNIIANADIDGASIILDSTTGNFIAKNNGSEFSSSNSAYAGMILGMTIDGVDEADQSYDLTTSFVVPNSLKFRLDFVTPPSELVEIVCSVSFGASSGGQDLFMSLSNHASYGSNSLSHPNQFETVVWNPPGRGTINQITARWIVASGNLEAIGSANALFIAAKTDNVSGTPKLYWGGDATEEYSPLIIKAVALPLEASISYNP
jgi:hypothetical protein